MKTITDFYAAWDAASAVAFLEDHISILRQISEFIDVFPFSGKSTRRFWADVRFMTTRLHTASIVWKQALDVFNAEKLRVELGFGSERNFKRMYPKCLTALIERPILRNPYQGLRNAAKDAPVAVSRKSSKEDAPNPRQRRDIDPKNLSPEVRARLYPDWQPKPRKSRKTDTSLE